MNKQRILIVEDEQVICNFITAILTSHGYDVICAASGREALSLAATYAPDLILLDLGLPDRDGLQVLHGVREWTEVPVIVVSARQNEQEKVLALDSGANDYVTKPFGNSELLARIRTALRLHAKIKHAAPDDGERIVLGGLVVDGRRRSVAVDGAEVHLTPIEYKIVTLLSRNAGKVLTHDFIIRSVWGPYASDSQLLRVNMANIRRKLERNPADPRYILTEVGVGYRMAEPDPLTDSPR